MEQFIALLMLAAIQGGCLVETGKYLELVTTTDNYKLVDTLKDADAREIKKAFDEMPPEMKKVEAMQIDRIYVLASSDILPLAVLLYSDKGCLRTVMNVPGRLYQGLKMKMKMKPGI